MTTIQTYGDKKYNNTNAITTICPLCKSRLIVFDVETGEVICSSCGIVVSENSLDNTDATTRTRSVGAPTSLIRHDMGLSTIIGRTNRDASGNMIDPSTYSKMHRLRTWDFRTQQHTPSERNFRIAFDRLSRFRDKLNLPDAVINKTAYIYRKVQQRGLIRGRTIDAILAACVCIACRELGVPKTLKEVAEATAISERVLSKNYRLLKFELDLTIPILDPMKCITKVASKINLNEKIRREAIVIMNDIIGREISASKDPMGLAATALYIACIKRGEERTQSEIANAAGITEVTLRSRHTELKSKLPQLNN